MSTYTEAEYLDAARAADAPSIARWRTSTCPECETLVREGTDPLGHVFVNGAVAVGCGGYWVISPAALGITVDGGWEDWTTDITENHTCHTGPLCAYWHTTSNHPEDPGGCIHESCMEIVHEFCPGCCDMSPAAEWCGTHAVQANVMTWGTYSGYAGGRCSYATLSCGCTLVDEQADIAAAR
jgi:hypothetical protein